MSWKASPNFMAIKFIIIWGFLEKKWKKISEMYTFEMTSLLLSNTESNLKKPNFFTDVLIPVYAPLTIS